MPRPQRDVEAALLRKGFVQHETDHSYFVYFRTNGQKSVFKTKTSHGAREISDPLLGQMARQVGLNKRDFLDLVDCPMSRAVYETRAMPRR